jgi:hypothetical protein
MYLLILSRILDVFTTYLNVNKWGWDVEGNIFMRNLGESGWFIPYQIIVVLFLIILLERLPKWKGIIYKVLTIMSLLVAISNFVIYLTIR